MIATIVICSLIILGCFVACAIGVSKAMQMVSTANAGLDKRQAELDRREYLMNVRQDQMTREHAEFGQQALDLNLRLSVCDGQRREALRQLRELQTARV
jgi:hypothetical protein